MTFATRSLLPSDRDEALALILEVMDLDPSQPEREFHIWKHEENPFGPSFGRVAVDGQGEIVALRLFMRWQFRHTDARFFSAVRAVDTVTHPRATRQGLFSRLTVEGLDDLSEAGVRAVFNTPNTKPKPGYIKLGWSEIGRAPIALRTGVRGLRRANGWHSSAKWGLPTDVGEAAGSVDWDGLDIGRERRRSGWLATDVTPDFLRWRYGYPALNYRVMVDDRDGEPAAVVFRLRPRGGRLDLAVCWETGPTHAVRRLIAAALRESRADAATRLQPARYDDRFVRLQGRGPEVVWKPVGEPTVPAVDDLDLSYGDIELF